MKFSEKELEYLITYAEQLKVLAPRITYNDELIKDLFYNMKEKTKVSDDNLHRDGTYEYEKETLDNIDLLLEKHKDYEEVQAIYNKSKVKVKKKCG